MHDVGIRRHPGEQRVQRGRKVGEEHRIIFEDDGERSAAVEHVLHGDHMLQRQRDGAHGHILARVQRRGGVWMDASKFTGRERGDGIGIGAMDKGDVRCARQPELRFKMPPPLREPSRVEAVVRDR